MPNETRHAGAAAANTPAPSPGKEVGGARYIHVDALPWLSVEEQDWIARAEALARIGRADWNVAKIQKGGGRVSLMAYEGFFEDPFPPLRQAWSADLQYETVRIARHDTTDNPPILHRKELLLPADHPKRAPFAELTLALDARGLFKDSSKIGRRRPWVQRLADAGVEIDGHRVVTRDADEESRPGAGDPTVHRHKTAISRSQLSGPMQALARGGFLDGERSVLDYGCGRGDDVNVLQAAGIPAHGWDPHYAPDARLEPADVVNLGFVINVIEEPAERERALASAFSLARQVLTVGVMTVGRADVSGMTPYRDGYVTARNTFQKYFTQREAQDLITRVTGEEAIPVAPGVFMAFRDKLEEQRFLDRRSRRHYDISHLLAIAPPVDGRIARPDTELSERQRELVHKVWRCALERGRIPHAQEVPDRLEQDVRAEIGSLRKALQLAQAEEDTSQLTAARDIRMGDLRVYFALNLFNRRQAYSQMPPEMQRDIKAFFGSYREATEAGRALLYSVNDPDTLLQACQASSDAGVGHLFDAHSLQLHAELIARLPEVLRTYIGCAEKLYGTIDAETVDLVKIHIQSGKLTLQRYDDFFGKPLPRLVERIKIKMRDQDVDFFDHTGDKAAPRLTLKSRYMGKDQAGYNAQREFDRQLADLGLFDLSGYGPDASTLARGLTGSGYRIAGFQIVPSQKAPGPKS